MQIASLLNHELPERWPQADCDGTARKDPLCETPFRTSLKHERSQTDVHCQFKKQCVQSQEWEPTLQNQDGLLWELQEREIFNYYSHMLPDTVSDEMEVEETSAREACFGMLMFSLPSMSGGLAERHAHIQTTPMTLVRDCTAVWDEIVDLDSRTSKILRTLKADVAITLQTFTVPIYTENKTRRKGQKGETDIGFVLCVNIYGPRDLADVVGDFASQCKLFLQDPQHCDRNVEYLNPHRMPFDEVVFTSSLQLLVPESSPPRIEVRQTQDLFRDFECDEDLVETDLPPDCLKTALKPHRHQKKALTFMLRREAGWSLAGDRQEIWSRSTDEIGSHTYTNHVTCETSDQPPPNFQGGILADAMGLGKTLTIIALIALTLNESGRSILANGEHSRPADASHTLSTTLIVVPLSLIDVWTSQLQSHVYPHTFKWTVFHGNNRTKTVKEFQCYDLVITTYHTVLAEWKRYGSARTDRSMHSFAWYRIVLDEAHLIRQASTMLACAVFALESSCRWAVTGTPVQNRLTDLASLFKFLRVYPFDDLETFRYHVMRTWKTRSDPEALAKLKLLINSITIRRPKREINLPSRMDHIYKLELSQDERTHYESVRNSTIHKIDSVLDGSEPKSCLNALQMITTLRLICNHGVSEKERNAPDIDNEMRWGIDSAQQAFDSLRDTGQAYCMRCRQDLSFIMADASDCGDMFALQPRVSKDFQILCPSCIDQEPQACHSFLSVCNHLPRCSSSLSSGITTPNTMCDDYDALNGERPASVPTKIKSLLAGLAMSQEGEKSVVFSYWTKTLDLIEIQLKALSFPYNRLDGRLSASKRNLALQDFRSQPRTAVLLISITCGAVGLDLTAASRAYIMEPQWNPMAEEQALDRIHRIGQTQPVTTIRYIMKDTWEENVANLQEKKRDLAEIVLSKKALKPGEASQSRLMYLRSLIE